jgi:hypothetical protein
MTLTVSNKTIMHSANQATPSTLCASGQNAPTCNPPPQLIQMIDKLSLTLSGYDQAEKTETMARALDFKDQGWASQVYLRNGYSLSLRLLPHHLPSSVVISLLPKMPSRPFMRIEFNPSKMGKDSIFDLYHGELALLLCGGLPELHEKARISRIDYALDIVGVDLQELLLASSYSVRSMKYDRHGRMETLYLGNPKSATQTRIYDKVAQSKNSGEAMSTSTTPITRVERVLRNAGLLRNIHKLKNPFSTLVVGATNQVNSNIPSHQWRMFWSYVREHTAQAALAILPPSERKKFLYEIKHSNPTWWNAEIIWSEWPGLVNSLGITNFGTSCD